MALSNRERKSAQKKKLGLRARVNLMCKECIYDPLEEGRWREQVDACTDRGCPLWPVRPKTTKRPDV